MNKQQVRGLFFWKGKYSHCIPSGLKFIDKLWWRFMPGTIITVAWPKGQIKVGPSHRLGWNGIGEYFEYVESSDPNDHYRPWLEENVGKQSWDWNWGLIGDNVTGNKLTIKIRKGREKYATLAAILWS